MLLAGSDILKNNAIWREIQKIVRIHKVQNQNTNREYLQHYLCIVRNDLLLVISFNDCIPIINDSGC